MPDYLTVREVAAIYKVNQITVRRHIRSGKLRAVKVGGRVRVRKEDADALALPMGSPHQLQVLVEEPTPEEIGRRRRLIARMDDLKASMQPLGFSIVDVIRDARDADGGSESG